MTKRCDRPVEIEVLYAYLEHRKGKGRNIYVPKVTPIEVASHLTPSSRNLCKSLRTSSPKKPAILAAPIVFSKLAKCDEIRKQRNSSFGIGMPIVVPSHLKSAALGISDEFVFSKTALTPQLSKNIVAVRVHSWVAQDAEDRDQYDDVEFAEIFEFSQMSEAEMLRFYHARSQCQEPLGTCRGDLCVR